MAAEPSPSQKGRMAEASVALVATNLGWDVHLPFGDGSRADMVLQDSRGDVFRTQVKWGRLHGEVIKVRLSTSRTTPTRGYVRSTYGPDEIDLLAVWCEETNQAYAVPISEVQAMTYLHLRLGPTRNNQSIGVRYASDYFLGAVAQLGERSAGSRKVRGSIPLSYTS